MRTLIAAVLASVSCSGLALAESCEDKFKRILVEGNGKAPVKIHLTQKIKGGMESKNWNYQDGKGNWMSEVIEPANMAWSLVQENVLYASNDKGKTWTKVRTMDTGKGSGADDLLRKRAATARNARCGEEKLGSATHQVVEAEYDLLGQFKAVVHDKYWVHPETGYIPRVEQTMKAKGFESFTVQVIEPAQDLKLPTPQGGS